MKITQEDVDSIIQNLYSISSEGTTPEEAWSEGRHNEKIINFLWDMYQELTESKGE